LNFDTTGQRFSEGNESPFQLERHRGEGRKMDQDRMLAAHPLSIFAQNASIVANVAAAIRLRVGIDYFSIKPGLRHAQPVIMMDYGRSVYDKCNHLGGTRLSQERNDAVVGVVKIDPIKTCVTVVLIPQGRLTFVSVIEMLNEPV